MKAYNKALANEKMHAIWTMQLDISMMWHAGNPFLSRAWAALSPDWSVMAAVRCWLILVGREAEKRCKSDHLRQFYMHLEAFSHMHYVNVDFWRRIKVLEVGM